MSTVTMTRGIPARAPNVVTVHFEAGAWLAVVGPNDDRIGIVGTGADPCAALGDLANRCWRMGWVFDPSWRPVPPCPCGANGDHA